MLHESTIYFERCHAVELRDDVTVEQRAECWQRWLAWYSNGQTAVRQRHARERVALLLQGEAVDPLPTVESSAAEVATTEANSTTRPTLAPDPVAGTSALEPGPVTVDRSIVGRPPRRSGSPVCEPVCRPPFDQCLTGCSTNPRVCLSACQSEYQACMQACL